MNLRQPLVVAIGLVVPLVALTVPSSSAPAPSTSAATVTAPVLEWDECPPDRGFDPRQECASLTVPLDYDDPDGETIEIAVSRILTADPAKRRGILLENPGGPGSDGIYDPAALADQLPQSVLDRYDLVGFDPRGLHFSAPVSCALEPEDLDLFKFIPYPSYDLDISDNVSYARDAAAGCDAASGDVLPHITTANTARDMDMIRAAYGEEKISYIGYSYGTYLGAVYTQLFPERTDRFLLDSVIHPRRIWRETFASWGYAVELAFTGFTDYAAKRHQTHGLGDTPAKVYAKTLELIDEVEAVPFPYQGIEITGDFFRELIRNNVLRNDRAFPPAAELFQLMDARESVVAATLSPRAERLLRSAAKPSPLLAVDYPTPAVENQFAMPWAVVCGDADWPESPETYQRLVRTYDALFPIHGRAAANIWPCAFWPFDPEPAVEIGRQTGGRTLLVQSVREIGRAHV